jgi:tryptophan halogenase
MAAATFSRLLKPGFCKITLIERPQAKALGATEATIPAFQRFNNLLGIGETAFLQATDATFKLGIRFDDWTRPREGYFNAFCPFGGPIGGVPFHHYWLRLRECGDETSIFDYSLAAVAAALGRFARPSSDASSILSLHSHAYHFDGDLYANLLKDYACARGVVALDRSVADASLSGENGFIETLMLDDGGSLAADFYIDCSGFPGVLLEGVLKTGYEDWSHWLPCDRAISQMHPHREPLRPYGTATALSAGWRWSAPLCRGMDSGLIYSRAFLSDGDAAAALSMDSRADFRATSFVTGRPRKFWNKNCLSLPGGFLEPLESTHIHLIQTGILKLFGTFPDLSFNAADADEYNRLTGIEYERIRDFLILHYATAGRDDTPFWRHCANMPIPGALKHKIELFRGSARLNMLDNEHFADHSWLSVLIGHGILPRSYDPLADVPSTEEVERHLHGIRRAIRQAAEAMPPAGEHMETAARVTS